MKKIIFLMIAVIFTATVSSCGSTVSLKQNDKEVAGYTLKNKKELMQQKVLNQKTKTVIATP